MGNGRGTGFIADCRTGTENENGITAKRRCLIMAEQKVALVTGSSRGLGKAMEIALAEQG